MALALVRDVDDGDALEGDDLFRRLLDGAVDDGELSLADGLEDVVVLYGPGGLDRRGKVGLVDGRGLGGRILVVGHGGKTSNGRRVSDAGGGGGAVHAGFKNARYGEGRHWYGSRYVQKRGCSRARKAAQASFCASEKKGITGPTPRQTNTGRDAHERGRESRAPTSTAFVRNPHRLVSSSL